MPFIRGRSRTLAVSRRAMCDGLEAQMAIGAVGSTALFGPDPGSAPRPVPTRALEPRAGDAGYGGVLAVLDGLSWPSLSLVYYGRLRTPCRAPSVCGS